MCVEADSCIGATPAADSPRVRASRSMYPVGCAMFDVLSYRNASLLSNERFRSDKLRMDAPACKAGGKLFSLTTLEIVSCGLPRESFPESDAGVRV